jgi:hypothetical protein
VLLYSAPLSPTGKARLKAMAETNDGFEIARRDLEIRGPGEFMGARQSGDACCALPTWPRTAPLLQRAPAGCAGACESLAGQPGRLPEGLTKRPGGRAGLQAAWAIGAGGPAVAQAHQFAQHLGGQLAQRQRGDFQTGPQLERRCQIARGGFSTQMFSRHRHGCRHAGAVHLHGVSWRCILLPPIEAPSRAADPIPGVGTSRLAPHSWGFHTASGLCNAPRHNLTMTLTELKYIVAVARERHFGRAAEACFVSQPTCRWLSRSWKTNWT